MKIKIQVVGINQNLSVFVVYSRNQSIMSRVVIFFSILFLRVDFSDEIDLLKMPKQNKSRIDFEMG